MERRALLAAGAAVLAAPRVAASQGVRVLRFVPQSDLAVLDPIWTPAYVTRNHGFLVFDTLFGQRADFSVVPQMAAGAAAEDDGRTWLITLRDGLRFHDDEPVLARDCAASLRRWGRRDSFGQALMAATDELSAPDDRTLRFRLKRPFPLLPDALGKTGSNMPAIMPERLARADAFTQITEMVGSGPYRFKPDERVSGSRVVYERFAGYRPREGGGAADFTAGPKVAHFDRVEWHVMPDSSTAASALRNGEVDWWENPAADLLPLLRRARGVTVEVLDQTGLVGMMRPNHLHPPFDNAAVRRAVMRAVNQADFMAAAGGSDPAMTRTGVGVFCPVSPMANDAGMEALNGPRDLDRARRELREAGYRGERVVFLGATDLPTIAAISEVGADLLRRLGMNVDYQAMDWGTVVQRRVKRELPEQGGWNVAATYWSGIDTFNPAVQISLRGNGAAGWWGWPTFERMEALRDAWLEAPDLPTQQRIAREMQAHFFEVVPYWPLGMLHSPTAYRSDLSGVPRGFALFWNVRRGA